MNGRLIKFWKSAEELPGLVALSLTRTIKTYPAIGWVRANNVANEDVLAEINELRKQNAALQSLLSEAENQQKPIIEDIANIDSTLIVHGTYETQTPGYSPRKHVFEYNLTWRELFSLISPYLVENPSDAYVKRKIA
ncbi:hypothetical protein JGX50_20635, partial [Acinetobacter baumannii]|nr:hypothetical protein [Acinetobacter baumannii]